MKDVKFYPFPSLSEVKSAYWYDHFSVNVNGGPTVEQTFTYLFFPFT